MRGMGGECAAGGERGQTQARDRRPAISGKSAVSGRSGGVQKSTCEASGLASPTCAFSMSSTQVCTIGASVCSSATRAGVVGWVEGEEWGEERDEV